jgi:hypothetical protein
VSVYGKSKQLVGTFTAKLGEIGKATSNRIQGALVLADPILACKDLNNKISFAGKIVLVKRGQCSFSEKAHFVGRMKPRAILVYDTAPTDQLLYIKASTRPADDVSIPVLMAFLEDGLRITEYLNKFV